MVSSFKATSTVLAAIKARGFPRQLISLLESLVNVDPEKRPAVSKVHRSMEEIRVRSRRSCSAVSFSDQLLPSQSHHSSAIGRDDAEHDPAKLQLSPITRRAHLHFLNPDGLHPPVLGNDIDQSSGQRGISELLAERPLLDLSKGSSAGLTRRLQDPVLEHSRLKLVKAGLAILKVIKV